MKNKLLNIFSNDDTHADANSAVRRLLTPIEIDAVYGGDTSCGPGGSDHKQGGGSYTQGGTGSYSQGGSGGGSYTQTCPPPAPPAPAYGFMISGW